MKKLLLLLTLLVSFGGMVHAAEETVQLDFSEKKTIPSLPSASSSTISDWSYSGYDFSSKGCYKNTSNAYLMMGSKGYLRLPVFNGTVKSVSITVSSGCSTSATMGLYKDSNTGTQIGNTYTAKQNATHIFEVAAGQPSTTYYLVNNSSKNFQLTKVVVTIESAPTEPQKYTPSFAPISLELGGEGFQITANEPHPAFTFTSKNPKIATVTDEGVVTAVAAGETSIDVSWTKDANWTEGSTTIPVTVTKPLADPQFTFRHDVVKGKLGVGVVGQAGRHLGNGKTTYASSDETVVTVNPNTGMITPADVHKAGTATITANLEATEEYKAATASYTVIIEDPDQGDLTDGDPVMFDFPKFGENVYGMTLFDSNNSLVDNNPIYETAITSINPSGEPISLTFEGDYRLWNGNAKDGVHVRAYSGCKLIFAAPEGYTITKITINQTQGKYTSDSGNITYGSSDILATWEATTDVNNVELTVASTPGHGRIQTMTVTYKAPGSTQHPAKLSFTKTCYNELVGTDITVNAVNNPNNVGQIYYSIDNLTAGEDYTIVSQGDNLNLKVNEIGVYTLRAKSDATDTYLPGIAILRLNVFPNLTMNVDGSEPVTNEDGVVLPAEGGKISLDGEYPNTVKVFYSLNDGEEVAYDGTPIEILDDAKLTYHMEYAETAAYRHTTIKNVLVTPAAPVHDVDENSSFKEGDKITFSAKEGTTIYLKEEFTSAATAAPRRASATEGWATQNANTYEYTVPALDNNQMVVLKAKAVKGNLESEETAPFGIKSDGGTTGVEAIEAEGNEAEVEWFSLQGVRVENPTAGLYIRRQGNKVEKVVVK